MARILYFGIARDLAGTAEDTISHRGVMASDDFWRIVIAMHPQLERVRPICRLAVDMSYAGADIDIREDSELAIIPPVAGG